MNFFKGVTDMFNSVLVEGTSPKIVDNIEDSIREKAYLLWEAAGRPEGDGVEFWIQAEEELA